MSVSEKLAEIGLTIPQIAAPVASYLPAVISENLVFTAGQLPFVDGKMAVTGKVGSEVSAETANGLARTAVLNALAAVESQIGSLDRVTLSLIHI